MEISNLYPIKFKTIFKEKIWGGNKLKTLLNKDYPLSNCGETWEISGVKGEESIVSNGPLQNQSLPEIISIYKERLVGQKLYNKHLTEFPLLIKFIDANDDLSIQVHPGDELAKKRHNSFGKTEMWYVLQADEGAKLNAGFNKQVDEKTYLNFLQNHKIEEILNYENVKEGDVFFLPAGRVHYIGKGICLAEIQQTSDITYRIFDFDRKDKAGHTRELHTDLALEAIDYAFYENYKTDYILKQNTPSPLVQCPYFTTNLISFNKPVDRNYTSIDSFIIYIVLEGGLKINYGNGTELAVKGDCLLIPAELKIINLEVSGNSKILEVYVEG